MVRNEPFAMAVSSGPKAPFEGPLSAAEADGGGAEPVEAGVGAGAEAGAEAGAVAVSAAARGSGDTSAGKGKGDCQ